MDFSKFVMLDIGEPTSDELLSALSVVDGRYAKKVWDLRQFCSEAGLQRLRTVVEIEWLLFLNHFNILPLKLNDEGKAIKEIYYNFSFDEAVRIKQLEKETNHDVKAVEYFIVEELKKLGLPELCPFVHILLTSEDVTNAAYGLMIYEVRERLVDELKKLIKMIEDYAKIWKAVPMLAHTHGQPASPTTVGKEFVNYAARLSDCLSNLTSLPIKVKWNGATGNFNAHRVVFPNRAWPELSYKFVEWKLGFVPLPLTTQTNNYAYLADILHQFKNISSVLIDFCQDMWFYISLDYLKQKLEPGEVGSSTMPHKVNPIDFENAEGNFGLAETNFGYLPSKLQKSRMQRDLSDSTVLRNLGTFFGWFLIGVKSTQKGLGKISINQTQLEKDLSDNPAIISEAIQQMMRRYGQTDAYEKLKEITRGQTADLKDLQNFVKQLQGVLPADAIFRLMELQPENYLGDAIELVENYFEEKKKKGE